MTPQEFMHLQQWALSVLTRGEESTRKWLIGTGASQVDTLPVLQPDQPLVAVLEDHYRPNYHPPEYRLRPSVVLLGNLRRRDPNGFISYNGLSRYFCVWRFGNSLVEVNSKPADAYRFVKGENLFLPDAAPFTDIL